MSFGFSISDVICLVQLTTQAYRSWKDACGEHSEITSELNSLAILLRRVEAEAKLPGSLLNRKHGEYNNLVKITRNCGSVVVQLRDIVEKYEGLGKSRWRNWDRLRLGNKNLGELRGKLTLHTSSLSTYLNTLGVSGIGRVEKRLDELPEMRKAIDGLAAEIRAGRREDSVMTTYTNDEKDVWRQFRRELIGEGFSSRSIHKFKSPLKEYLRRLDDQGLLEEEEPQNFEEADGEPETLYIKQRLQIKENVLTTETRPISKYEGPIEEDQREVNSTYEGHIAQNSGVGLSRTSAVFNSPTPSRPFDSEHGAESARGISPTGCKLHTIMDFDQLQLSNIEIDIPSPKSSQHRARVFIADETGSITHICGECNSSNDVCICASNLRSGRERANSSQSRPQNRPSKPTNYNVLNLEEGEADEGRREGSYRVDDQFRTSNGAHTEVCARPLATPPDAKSGHESMAPNLQKVEASTLPPSTSQDIRRIAAESPEMEYSELSEPCRSQMIGFPSDQSHSDEAAKAKSFRRRKSRNPSSASIGEEMNELARKTHRGVSSLIECSACVSNLGQDLENLGVFVETRGGNLEVWVPRNGKKVDSRISELLGKLSQKRRERSRVDECTTEFWRRRGEVMYSGQSQRIGLGSTAEEENELERKLQRSILSLVECCVGISNLRQDLKNLGVLVEIGGGNSGVWIARNGKRVDSRISELLRKFSQKSKEESRASECLAECTRRTHELEEAQRKRDNEKA